MSNFVLDTRKRLSDYITKHDRKQSAVAREMGVSTATLSQFLSDCYPGDNDTVAKKAVQFLEIGAARERMAAAPPTCTTVGNTKRILTSVRMAHEAQGMTLIYGPAGCSKTTALRYYTEQVNGAVYVQADATTGSARNILISILEEMGEATANTSTAQMMRKVLGNVRGTSSFLIIDEGQHLNERAFDTIRAINDKAEIGIAIAGNRSILRRMFGRYEVEYDQIYSRFDDFCELHNRYSYEDIASMFAGYSLDGDCIKHLLKVACQKGGLRRPVKQYKLAANIANTLHEDFSLPFLLEAEKRTNIVGRIIV